MRRLTAEQTGIYDAYAGAFEIIHNNLSAALEASNITGTGPDGRTKTLNAQAKSAARSAFESAKQRFFNHLITAMKTPTLIAAIDRDLAEGHACVVQIVSTGEALLERRLADIPTEEWADTLREELPPITQFLNRMLALTIDLQGTIFEVFEGLLRAKIEGAVAAGVYDRGVETITAHSLRVAFGQPRQEDLLEYLHSLMGTAMAAEDLADLQIRLQP